MTRERNISINLLRESPNFIVHLVSPMRDQRILLHFPLRKREPGKQVGGGGDDGALTRITVLLELSVEFSDSSYSS